MRKTPTSAPHSPQPTSSSPRHPNLMEKDEQLQLCIQRFVSDTQSMMNQFNDLVIGEIRRFAGIFGLLISFLQFNLIPTFVPRCVFRIWLSLSIRARGKKLL